MRLGTVLGLSAALWLGAAAGTPSDARAAATERMGPPLICFPLQIGEHASLPWGDDAFEGSPRFDRKKVVDETMKALSADQPVIVRMETIRRAVVYMDKNEPRGGELLGRLASKALDAVAKEDSAAAAGALFDAGYFAATYSQWGGKLAGSTGEDKGVPGYAWVRRAIELSGGETSMEFGAALMLCDREANRELCVAHVRKAAAGAEPGSLLAKNLQGRFEHFGVSVEEAAKGTADARGGR
jgi:hypothetical protein